MTKAYLLLENGMLFEGKHRGASGCSVGEAVFNTSAAGYQEALTDPSYYGQVICMTYPLIGNYGINDRNCETQKSWINGFIVRKLCDTPSNWKCTETVDEYLKKNGVVGMEGIDTRRLARVIRDNGTMNCAIWSEDQKVDKDELMKKIKAFTVVGAIKTVRDNSTEDLDVQGSGPNVALLDFGVKRGAINSLKKRDCSVKVLSAWTSAEDIIKGGFDGVMLTDGPGDPEENTQIIANIKKLADAKVPMFGYGLGHQMLALAAGAKTVRMKFGHHGANYPVRDEKSGRTYITCQNHGYAVDAASVDGKTVRISHVNINDGSVEGIELVNAPAFSVQFTAEGDPGPIETAYLFDKFVENMKTAKEGK